MGGRPNRRARRGRSDSRTRDCSTQRRPAAAQVSRTSDYGAQAGRRSLMLVSRPVAIDGISLSSWCSRHDTWRRLPCNSCKLRRSGVAYAVRSAWLHERLLPRLCRDCAAAPRGARAECDDDHAQQYVREHGTGAGTGLRLEPKARNAKGGRRVQQSAQTLTRPVRWTAPTTCRRASRPCCAASTANSARQSARRSAPRAINSVTHPSAGAGSPARCPRSGDWLDRAAERERSR